MTDTVTPEVRSRIMSRIRGRDTGPELALRRQLHAAGYRFRVDYRWLPGRPDLAFTARRAAVFVHGCLWHGCPEVDARGRPHCKVPATNTGFWAAKIARNRERDEEVRVALLNLGWKVIVVWECDLKGLAGALASAARVAYELGPPRWYY